MSILLCRDVKIKNKFNIAGVHLMVKIYFVLLVCGKDNDTEDQNRIL